MFYITLVIYNKILAGVGSRDALKDFVIKHGPDNVRLIIVDNSDDIFMKQHNIKYSEDIPKDGFIYIKSEGNVGLSKAYNSAIDYARHTSQDPEKDFIMFVDDDTEIPYEYFVQAYNTAKKLSGTGNGVNVLTGLIDSGGKPMSPTRGYRLKFFSGDYITNFGVYDKIACINTGMVVRLSALTAVGDFEEELFLDMMDFMLMHRLSEKGLCKVEVLDVHFSQTFSGRTRGDRKKTLERFSIYRRDFSRYCELTHRSWLYKRFGIFKRRLAIELKG